LGRRNRPLAAERTSRVKNVQIIDGADNCTFSIFQATDEEFGWLFPEPGQDIQFAEDIVVPAGHTLAELWDRPIRKADVVGIHGTVFYEFEKKRRYFPVSKRERDWDERALNEAQRHMYASISKSGPLS
jgi:hypothetical protein